MNKRTGLPSAPTDLVAVAVGRYQVLLAWAEGAGGAFGVRIERAAGNDPCGRFLDIGGVAPHITAFRDGSISPARLISTGFMHGTLPATRRPPMWRR